ncbi:MAG: hypothetical protein AAF399_15295 [Bacteroidota bacterium]
MSFYQLYDFCTVDRPLTPEQRAEIDTYSSRSSPSSHRATFVYNYGDFQYEALEVLLEHFDMALELNGWGTRRLMIKLPLEAVEVATMKRYNLGSSVFIRQVYMGTRDAWAFLDLHWAEEEQYDWVEGEGVLDQLLPLRNQLLQGDYRVLFLAWLHMAAGNAEMSEEEAYDEEEEMEIIEPPIPPGLGQLDDALESFIDFWQIDRGLIQAAAQHSAPKEPEPDFAGLISQLSSSEKDAFLKKVLQDSGPISQQLRQHLRQLIPGEPQSVSPVSYSLDELLADREHQWQLIKEAEREAEAQRHRAHMAQVKLRQNDMWAEVNENAELKTARGYDTATELLVDLHAYAHFSSQMIPFQNNLNKVLHRFGRSEAFQRRLKEKKVIKKSWRFSIK